MFVWFFQKLLHKIVFYQGYIQVTLVKIWQYFTPGAISALPTTSNSPYIVGLSPDGLIVGSVSIASADLLGGQAQMAVWGDDTSTDEIDGLLAGQETAFQL